MRVLERRTSWEGSTSEGTDSLNNTMDEFELNENESVCDDETDPKPLFDPKEFISNQLNLLDIENQEATKV